MHTHLAENNQEVAWVHELFPWSRSYLDVYDHYGLVTKHSIFAHSIHIDTIDYEIISKKGAAIAFCPTSNLFLGSGLFNLDEANKYNVNVGLGTDAGAGSSLSLIQTMNEAYKVTQLRKAFTDNPNDVTPLDPFEDLYLATLGGARALSLDQYIGSFSNGKEADFVVLDPQSTPLLGLRESKATSLRDKLFAIEILGDDRTVAHTYIMGKLAK
jgi:guanine deaminase